MTRKEKIALLEKEEHVFYSDVKIDGIANPSKYYDSCLNERILFIGKEPRDTQNRYTNQRDTLNWFCTHPFNGAFRKANKLASFILEQDAAKAGNTIVLDKLAWINVKKSPNTRQSYNTNAFELRNAYIINKDLLFQQIEQINPTIVFFGNTFNMGGKFVNFYDDWQTYRQTGLKLADFSSLPKNIANHFDPNTDLTKTNTHDNHLKCYYEDYNSKACLYFEMCHFSKLEDWHYEAIPAAINYWRNVKIF